MKDHRLAYLVLAPLLLASCGKKNDAPTSPSHAQLAAYEIHCLAKSPPPILDNGWNTGGVTEPPIPDNLPVAHAPIEVRDCAGLNGKPMFFDRQMYGPVAIVDCNARVVRFRSRDWHAAEAANIDPTGHFDVKIPYVTRLVSDAAGQANCWTRLLGHISGQAECGASPLDARIRFKAEWKVDDTPEVIMEPAAPASADLRNGPQCKLKPGSCEFTSDTSATCGG